MASAMSPAMPATSPKMNMPDGAPAPLAASVTQDRLRDAASGIVSKRALTLDQPARDITLDGIRHRGHFIGFRKHRAAITRVLHETILPLVATHLDMRDNVDPQTRNVALAHAAIEQVHVVGTSSNKGSSASLSRSSRATSASRKSTTTPERSAASIRASRTASFSGCRRSVSQSCPDLFCVPT